MNLSETAFIVPRAGGGHQLRWFTPQAEVDLCGHATLAAAHVLGAPTVFDTRSGPLATTAAGGWIEMDFPVWTPLEQSLPSIPNGLPTPVWSGIAGDDWLVELPSPFQVVDFVPDWAGIAALGRRALIITARAQPHTGHDIVSRVFGPNVGIPEDPVTGSAHCALAPYWASRIGKRELIGYQASARGGTVRTRLDGDRVTLGGQAVTMSEVRLLT